MATSKRIQQARQARDRRARIILVALGAVLLAVGGLQGPKIWKQLHKKSNAASPLVEVGTPTTTTGGASAAPAGTVLPAGGARLADTAVKTSPGAGQLASFTLFNSKDPFAQQVDTNATSTTPTPTPAAPPAPPVSTAPPVVVQMGNGSGPARVLPGVVISMNGVRERVLVGDGFPSGDPIFRLVSFKNGRAKIGLASGTFKDGSKTIVLARGKKVVLRDVTTGVTFKLRLVSWSSAT